MRYLFLFLLTFEVFAADDCAHLKNRFSCVKYITNYDGDTITFHLPGVHAFFGDRAKVRVFGIDTPELRPKGKELPCETEWGRVAKKLVAAELKNAKRIHLTNLAGHDKYGRILADIEYDGKNLKEVLLRNHLAVPYYGKKKMNINWCELRGKKK